MSELEATGRNVYLLQQSLQKMQEERDALIKVCQPIYDDLIESSGDYSVEHERQLVAIRNAMKRYQPK